MTTRLILAVGLIVAMTACGDEGGSSSTIGGGGAIADGGAPSEGGAPTTSTSGGGPSTSSGLGGTSDMGGQGGGSTGGASGELCPSPAFFCDDFELGTLGSAPGGSWDPDSQGVLSADHAHSGTKAVRLDEGFNFQTLPLDGAPDVLFARVMMWSTFQGETADSRYSIMSTSTPSGDQAAIDSNGDLLVIHHYPNGEAGISSTLAVPTNQWTCVETSFDRTTRTFRSWVDGVEAVELDVPASDQDIPDAWSLFELSGVVYHGGTTTQYYDDVALSTERIGCP